MANYYPLIARAVAGLTQNTHVARQALYERARGALLTQLRNQIPAFSAQVILDEQQSLDEAIRQIESEMLSKHDPTATPCGRCGNSKCTRCGLPPETTWQCPDLKFTPVTGTATAEKAQVIIDTAIRNPGMSYAALQDYAARQANTGNYAVAAEIFSRISEFLSAGGNDEAMILAAFCCSYCVCRHRNIWPIEPAEFPPRLADRYLESKARFIASTLLEHGERKRLLQWVSGNSSGFSIRIQGHVHKLIAGASGDIKMEPPVHNDQIAALAKSACEFKLTIPCLYNHKQLIAGTPWW